MKKKIVLFGATGGTGSEILLQALSLGHEVTVCIRNTGKFSYQHANLRVLHGDVTNIASIQDAFAHADVVISALGTRSTKPTTVWSEGLENIISSMKLYNIRRLITISAGGLDVNPLNNVLIRLLTRYVLQKILRGPYDDLRKMEIEVKASGLDYTIVRPPRLTDNPVTGVYRSSIGKFLPATKSISRADVAHYILNHLDDQNTFKSIIHLSY